MSIHFHKANPDHLETLFAWLDEPHVREFWDNSQAHRDDIVNFVEGRQVPSSYFGGEFSYWIGTYDGHPFSLVMTLPETLNDDTPDALRPYLRTGAPTYSIDFMVGHTHYLGKGLAAPTLEAFCAFFKRDIDPTVEQFLIDPDVNNPRATHVYRKAGFISVGSFEVEKGFFEGHQSLMMIKKMGNA